MRRLVLTTALLLCTATAAVAASPAPTAAPTPLRINVEKLQPRWLFPKKKLHVEMIVEVNRLGQVTRVRSIKPSHNQGFDEHAYGNALQAFIRTPDGHVVLGSYRLIYDYDPKTLRIRRDVVLVRTGGVDPNAEGAALEMMDIVRRNAKRKPVAAVTPNPAPTLNARNMPDLPQVMHTPPH
jgi:hypothetical protein